MAAVRTLSRAVVSCAAWYGRPVRAATNPRAASSALISRSALAHWRRELAAVLRIKASWRLYGEGAGEAQLALPKKGKHSCQKNMADEATIAQ